MDEVVAGAGRYYELSLWLLLCSTNHRPTVYFRFALISSMVAFKAFALPDALVSMGAAYIGLTFGGVRREWARYALMALFMKWFVDTGDLIYVAWAACPD